jgi:hypothetical protein
MISATAVAMIAYSMSTLGAGKGVGLFD